MENIKNDVLIDNKLLSEHIKLLPKNDTKNIIKKVVENKFRNTLQEDVNKAESDIDVMLQLENESKYGK